MPGKWGYRHVRLSLRVELQRWVSGTYCVDQTLKVLSYCSFLLSKSKISLRYDVWYDMHSGGFVQFNAHNVKARHDSRGYLVKYRPRR
jgi:hypothetical protein